MSTLFQPIDNKRDQFRKYLEASGVIEVLSKSITKLMESPEKPESPVEFIRANMGRTQKEVNEIEFLKEEVEVYKKQVNDLKTEIAGLKLERQAVENGHAKEVTAVVVDASVKDDIVVENQSDKQTDGETKKTEEVEPTPVLVAKVCDDDVQKIDTTSDAKAEIPAVSVEVTDVKIEPKPEDIKVDDKPAPASAVDASEATDK